MFNVRGWRTALVAVILALGAVACDYAIANEAAFADEGAKAMAEMQKTVESANAQAQVYKWLSSQLSKVETAVDKTASFASEQVPLFVQEFLTFKAIWSWFMVGVLFLASASLGYLALCFAEDSNGGSLFLIVPLIASGILMFTYLYDALLVTFAPRVYLVTEFIRFFK